MTEKEISWDLTRIYTSPSDPKIDEDMKKLLDTAKEMKSKYKGKINVPNFTNQNLLALLKEIEELNANVDEIELFTMNTFNANMTIQENQNLKNKFDAFRTSISKTLAFLSLELGELIKNKQEFITDPILANYKHYLQKLLKEHEHKLSEIEEQIILEKDQHGIKAWQQLQATWLNTRKFKVMVENKEKILSYGEANSLLTHPDRETRISANRSIYGGLGKDQEIYSSALRNICADWINMVKRRKYKSPMHHSLIVNDVSEEIINNLMETIKKNVNVYQKYLKLKAKLLNLPKLSCADILAPLPFEPEKKYSWEEAKQLILEAYGNFDEEFKNFVEKMFDENNIDASIRVGKRNGAYCATWFKNKSALILMSYTGTVKEIFTLIHELGHAIHAHLSTSNQTYLNIHPGYCVSETASIFGELLLTDLLLEKMASKEDKMSILAHVLDDVGQAAFQVSARVWFEQRLYEAVRKGEHLSGEVIAKYWTQSRDEIYGDSVDWFEEMKWEWAMKPHYYLTKLRFYNYPYVFAQLFVYTLYGKYKPGKEDFKNRFKELLSSGGSKSTIELAKIMGLDITDKKFWNTGIKQIGEFVSELEKLSS